MKEKVAVEVGSRCDQFRVTNIKQRANSSISGDTSAIGQDTRKYIQPGQQLPFRKSSGNHFYLLLINQDDVPDGHTEEYLIAWKQAFSEQHEHT
jgi:hypothetical protein